MVQIHNCNMMHRDLKPANIFIDIKQPKLPQSE
jgi:serine/threonine protein kinase